MGFCLNKFWHPSSTPPPLNQTIGNYQTETELHDPTNYSYIYLGSNIKENSKKVLKFIKYKEEEICRINDEINIMNQIDHPNILKMDEYFPFKEYICLVTPFIPFESLHSLLITKYYLGIPENMAKIMMRQLLEAVNYLHKRNIWHRDIKTENILIQNSDPLNPKILLADFGLAKRFTEGQKSNEFSGTIDYSAPEILKHIDYTEKVDIWSLGVTLFVMLTGLLPVPSYGTAPRECRYLISNGLLNFQLLSDYGISYDAIDLVMKMCVVDPKERISAEDALNHPWIVPQQSKNVIESQQNKINFSK